MDEEVKPLTYGDILPGLMRYWLTKERHMEGKENYPSNTAPYTIGGGAAAQQRISPKPALAFDGLLDGARQNLGDATMIRCRIESLMARLCGDGVNSPGTAKTPERDQPAPNFADNLRCVTSATFNEQQATLHALNALEEIV